MTRARTIGIGILAIALAAILILQVAQPFSILAATQVNVGEDGKPTWVFFLAPSGSGEKIQFFSESPSDMPTYEDPRGGEWVPQFDFVVEFEPEDVTCTYFLEDNTRFSDANFLRRIFGLEDNRVFDVSESFERSAPIKVSTNKNPEGKIIDGFAPQTQVSFTDGRDDEGIIIIQAQGGLLGKTDCISTGGDLAVAQGQDTGKIEFTFQNEQGARAPRDDFKIAYDVCEITEDKTELICTIGERGLPGVGTITVTADGEFLDYRYFPPTVGEPKIVSVITQAEIQRNTYGSVLVNVKNVGDDAGTFTLEGQGEITIVPSILSVMLEKGQEKEIRTSVIAPNVNEKQKFSGSFELCTVSQFAGKVCDSKSFSLDVLPDEAPGARCGDGICQLNEGFSTCANDCKQVATCDGNFEEVIEGNCRCIDGYDRVKDDFGREFCEESQTDNLIIFLAVVAAILFMVFIRLSMMNKKRGKRGR